MKRNTVASILIALVLAAVAVPAFALDNGMGGNTSDPEKPSAVTCPGR